MIPTSDQAKALDQVAYWFNHTTSLVFKLGGLAGTGKSSLIQWVHDALDLPLEQVIFVAPTNKAALVVQRRLDEAGLKANARTVHKTYYNKMERHCDNCPLKASLKNICHGVSGSNACGCFLDFHAKLSADPNARLVICDESSMINREVYDDLIASCNNSIRILFVGDHGQLEPVEDNPQAVKLFGKFDLMKNTDFVLEEIQRQAKGSAILKLAYQARNFGKVEYGDYGPGVRKVSPTSGQLDFDFRAPNIIGITYFSNVDETNRYHKGRISVAHLNDMWRRNLGIQTEKPVVGDRVVCRDFIKSASIAKGTLGSILNLNYVSQESYLATILMDDGREYEGLISSEQFGNNKQIWGRTHLDKWDYGYGLTCHTAQGSEFDSVVVFEPSLSFIKWLGVESYSRWLYTAITRAKHNLLLVG